MIFTNIRRLEHRILKGHVSLDTLRSEYIEITTSLWNREGDSTDGSGEVPDVKRFLLGLENEANLTEKRPTATDRISEVRSQVPERSQDLRQSGGTSPGFAA